MRKESYNCVINEANNLHLCKSILASVDHFSIPKSFRNTMHCCMPILVVSAYIALACVSNAELNAVERRIPQSRALAILAETTTGKKSLRTENTSTSVAEPRGLFDTIKQLWTRFCKWLASFMPAAEKVHMSPKAEFNGRPELSQSEFDVVLDPTTKLEKTRQDGPGTDTMPDTTKIKKSSSNKKKKSFFSFMKSSKRPRKSEKAQALKMQPGSTIKEQNGGTSDSNVAHGMTQQKQPPKEPQSFSLHSQSRHKVAMDNSKKITARYLNVRAKVCGIIACNYEITDLEAEALALNIKKDIEYLAKPSANRRDVVVFKNEIQKLKMYLVYIDKLLEAKISNQDPSGLKYFFDGRDKEVNEDTVAFFFVPQIERLIHSGDQTNKYVGQRLLVGLIFRWLEKRVQSEKVSQYLNSMPRARHDELLHLYKNCI